MGGTLSFRKVAVATAFVTTITFGSPFGGSKLIPSAMADPPKPVPEETTRRPAGPTEKQPPTGSREEAPPGTKEAETPKEIPKKPLDPELAKLKKVSLAEMQRLAKETCVRYNCHSSTKSTGENAYYFEIYRKMDERIAIIKFAKQYEDNAVKQGIAQEGDAVNAIRAEGMKSGTWAKTDDSELLNIAKIAGYSAELIDNLAKLWGVKLESYTTEPEMDKICQTGVFDIKIPAGEGSWNTMHTGVTIGELSDGKTVNKLLVKMVGGSLWFVDLAPLARLYKLATGNELKYVRLVVEQGKDEKFGSYVQISVVPVDKPSGEIKDGVPIMVVPYTVKDNSVWEESLMLITTQLAQK